MLRFKDSEEMVVQVRIKVLVSFIIIIIILNFFKYLLLSCSFDLTTCIHNITQGTSSKTFFRQDAQIENWSNQIILKFESSHQCLKCLTLVKRRETPYLLQQSMASPSLMLPPGSAITPIPFSHASSTASFQAV